MKYFLVIVASLLSTGKAFSQSANSERAHLFTELKNAKTDTAKVLGLINIGYNVYAGPQPDSAIIYYDKAFRLAKKIGYTKGVFKYYACYGDILSMRGNYDQALNISIKQVALAEKLRDTCLTGAAYNNIAGSYTDLGLIDKALEYYLKAITIYEERNDPRHLAAVYVNLLGIFSSVGHSPAQALKYGLKAIEVSRSSNNTTVLQEALLNVSYVYVKLDKINDALKRVTEAISISRKLDDKSFLTDELVELNNILVIQEKYSLLKANAEQIKTMAQQTGNKTGLAQSAYFLGLYYFDRKDVKGAEQYARKALLLAVAGDMAELQEKALGLLSDIALTNGSMHAYYTYRAKSDSLNEKLHSDLAIKNLQEFEAKYKFSKKEAQISSLNNERQIQKLTLQKRLFYIIALFVVIMLLLAVGFLVRGDSERKRKLLLSEKELRDQQIQTLEKEKELLTTQALMQGQERERSRLAKDLHDGLGGILTGTKYSLSNMKQNMIISAENAEAFEKTMNMLDQSITELRRVAHNMMPESLLKLSLNDALEEYCQQITNSGALKVIYQSFEIDDLVTNSTVNIAVYRVVQELINNVVKHASAKSAIVQLTFKEYILGITVEDDGKGMDIPALALAEGMGYRNIKSRIDFLKGSIDIQSEKDKGTSVLIKIPVV